MSLIKSISGIRGTIGGKPGTALTPVDVVKFVTGYARWIVQSNHKKSGKIVVGRDARVSGTMVYQLVAGTLSGLGFDVVNLGLATTPTTELAVVSHMADGGIILTASHNPWHWNALKLLNSQGEFLNSSEGQLVLDYAENVDEVDFEPVDKLGRCLEDNTMADKHIKAVLDLKLVDVEAIRKAAFRVVIDCVNSVGGLILPSLLEALGVKDVVVLNGTPDGRFTHNPEPLPENLTEISDLMKQGRADVGFVVDPDVDRLAIVCEDGTLFGEEYTLVAVADYILKHTPGNTVSNLSSTRALNDVTGWYGGSYTAASVGEVNVVSTMKETRAIIGGEGNGGVIYPACHYGRDALVGIALFLSHLAHEQQLVSVLKERYPAYYIDKQKLTLSETMDVDLLLLNVAQQYSNERVNTQDGVKIDFPDKWVQLRKSNTEPIIRIYSEASTKEKAEALTAEIIQLIKASL